MLSGEAAKSPSIVPVILDFFLLPKYATRCVKSRVRPHVVRKIYWVGGDLTAQPPPEGKDRFAVSFDLRRHIDFPLDP
jgi:hypothetical protein